MKAPAMFNIRNIGKTLVTRTQGTSEYRVPAPTSGVVYVYLNSHPDNCLSCDGGLMEMSAQPLQAWHSGHLFSTFVAARHCCGGG